MAHQKERGEVFKSRFLKARASELSTELLLQIMRDPEIKELVDRMPNKFFALLSKRVRQRREEILGLIDRRLDELAAGKEGL